MAHSSREKKAREVESRGGKKAHSKRASRGEVKSAKCVPYFRDKEGQFQLAVSRKRAFKSKNMPVSGKRKEGLAKCTNKVQKLYLLMFMRSLAQRYSP